MDPFWTPTLEDLKKYFTDEEWSKLTDYDKKNYTNIMENYNIMSDLDMNPEEPDFLKAWRIRNTSVSCTKMDIVEENVKENRKIDNIKPSEIDVKATSDVPTQNSTTITEMDTGKKVKRRKVCKSTTSEHNKVENIDHKPVTEKEKGTGKKMKKAIGGCGLFTQQEILESVRLDNTVGALYEYCLSGLFQKSCNIENDNTSTSSGIEVKVDKKQPTNIDCILKCLENIEFNREKLSKDHKHIYCEQCQRFYDFFCPHGHRIHIRSLPGDFGGTIAQYPEYLAIGRSAIPEAGIGVWSTAAIEKGVVWGPFKDTIIPEISDNERERRTLQDKLNYLLKDFFIIKRTWNTLINCARYEKERNVVWFKHKGEVYYRVCKRIPLATEILMFYTKEDVEKLGIDSKMLKNTKLEVARDGIVVNCDRCGTLYASFTLLQAHRKMCNNKTNKVKVETEESFFAIPLTKLSSEHNSSNLFKKKIDIEKIDHIMIQKPLMNIIDQRHDFSETQHLSSRVQYTENINNKISEGAGTTKLIKCKYCSKEFIEISELHEHEKNHTGGKPVHEVCNKGFIQPDEFKTHKRIHTGEKPYVCEVCNKGFTQTSSLKTHKRIHTGEKPYVCEVCNEGFSQTGHLKTHKRIHTGEKP